jgi:hypothetical protein
MIRNIIGFLGAAVRLNQVVEALKVEAPVLFHRLSGLPDWDAKKP